ncbi:uncharacterized protein ColSpa_10839 [Colletotrichum spaethianum]|uniref:Uncharacterized protein n=1 Tax=Colletotrichum spaethianum TaxID=700344 RepID=A0AA37USW0_9PEZI|nr:uncharacterized protein ColSpa_10839 [Colletotrichum spaethianum]GKT50658.1 hypothetical protein ColSpa_10839 [Colletotrichum spaethianum]
MVSPTFIRLVAGAVILAGVNGQVDTTTTSDISVTAVNPTDTTVTAVVPVPTILPITTSPVIAPPASVTTTTCNFNGTCRVITLPPAVSIPSSVTTLSTCNNRGACGPATTLTYPAPPAVTTLTRCNFSGSCSAVTRTNTGPIFTNRTTTIRPSTIWPSTICSGTACRITVSTGVSTIIRPITPTLTAPRNSTLITRPSVPISLPVISSRLIISSSRSATAPQLPPSNPPSNVPLPSNTTRPATTTPSVVVVAGEPALKAVNVIPLMSVLGAVAIGVVLFL